MFDTYTAGDIHSQIKIRPRNDRLKYSYYLVWFGFDFSVPGATPTAVKYFKREELDLVEKTLAASKQSWMSPSQAFPTLNRPMR